MASSHHGAPSSREPNEEIKRLMEKFIKQAEGPVRREYPAGRIGPDDEGVLAMAIAADPKHGKVILSFGKPVEWIGLGEKETKALIQMLIEKLKEIATEPFALEV